MANILAQQIDQLSKEKGLDAEIIHHALEDAMVAAAKRYFKTGEELQGRYDPETGLIEVFAVKEIVEEVEDGELEMSLEEALEIDDSFELGDYIELPKPTQELGRIAAQTAKQVINQKIREAEREQTYEEYSDRVNDLETGIVRRREGRDVILEIGRKRTEALLPYMEQSRIEQYNPGDRISVVIQKVHRVSKGPQIIVSRTDPELLIRLFEREIPEVYDNTVIIKKAVREGGERAKVAVASKDDSVDPVGACVGMKGSRINAVIRELRGEKIDIIQFSEDIVEYAINALNPARISRVLISDLEDNVLEVIVPEDQLSLAIGKKGQNVRLASKLLGWEIEIKSAEEKKREILTQMEQQFIDDEEPGEGAEGREGEFDYDQVDEAEIESAQRFLESDDEEGVDRSQPSEEESAEEMIRAAEEFLRRKEDEPPKGDEAAVAEAGQALNEVEEESEGREEERSGDDADETPAAPTKA